MGYFQGKKPHSVDDIKLDQHIVFHDENTEYLPHLDFLCIKWFYCMGFFEEVNSSISWNINFYRETA